MLPCLCSPHARLRADPVVLGTDCVCMYESWMTLLIEPQQLIFHTMRQLYDLISILRFLSYDHIIWHDNSRRTGRTVELMNEPCRIAGDTPMFSTMVVHLHCIICAYITMKLNMKNQITEYFFKIKHPLNTNIFGHAWQTEHRSCLSM